MEEAECGFEFFSDFDSANLARVVHVNPHDPALKRKRAQYVDCEDDYYATSPPGHANRSSLPVEHPDVEFNIWTKPDCAGTEYENSNRTWFYFGMKASLSSILVRLNLIDLNRQSKMYSQGMTPVYRILPGKPAWERIRDRPTYTVEDDIFTLSFKYRTPENVDAVTYFAFTYPYSYTDLQSSLALNDRRFAKLKTKAKDDIYYTREVVCRSLEGRRLDLITISSYHGISSEREPRLKYLFPDHKQQRPFRFIGKKVIFISARVHPGETPASFVFNGLLSLLLACNDPVAIQLRKLYVFKMIPFLNPDGVANGFYRTDTRGVNLNRMYLNPTIEQHPTIYAARALIRYYHYGFEKEDNIVPLSDDSVTDETLLHQDNRITSKVSHLTLDEEAQEATRRATCPELKAKIESWCKKCKNNLMRIEGTKCCHCVAGDGDEAEVDAKTMEMPETDEMQSIESGIFLYIDMHGHATKKGIFMYGNHFDTMEANIDCMLLPKLLSMNNHHFQFTACNFTERMMYLKDKRDGLSREGSGRVAVLRLTGLVKSYTMECNYNAGRMMNVLPSTIKENNQKLMHAVTLPPKFTPQIFEDVGKALGPSILDLTGSNPITRVPNSQFHTLDGVREWLEMYYVNVLRENRPSTGGGAARKLRMSTLNTQAATKASRLVLNRMRSGKVARRISTTSTTCKTAAAAALIPIERKENFETTATLAPRSTTTVLASKVLRTRSRTTRPFSTATKVLKHQKGGAASRATLIAKSKSREELQAKMRSLREQSRNLDQMKLQEICFIKTTEGKRMIAKYKANEESETVDNLIIEWDSVNGKAQLLTAKTRLNVKSEVFKTKGCTPEAGPSHQGLFRVHNFVKSKNKRPLKKVVPAATVDSAKLEKNKKRKMIKNLSA